MQHQIEHILLENYPNPPPPGFPYPPLPQIIHINDSESNKECSIESYYMTRSNSDLYEIIPEDNHELVSVDLNEPTAYVISIDEPTELSADIQEYKVQKSNYQIVEQNIIEIHASEVISEAKVVEIRVIETDGEISENEELQPKIVVLDDVQEKLDNSASFLITNNTTEENEDMKNFKVVPIIEHKFLGYPHSPPAGLCHVSVPNIVSENSLIVVGVDDVKEQNDCIEFLEKTEDETKIGEKNGIESKQTNGTTESNSLDDISTVEEDIKELRREIENHTSSGPILGQTIVTTQPKNDKDYALKRFSQTTIQEEDVEKNRIKTTICCCIKC